MTDMFVVPHTGEVLALKEVSLASIAEVVKQIADTEADLKSAKRTLADEVAGRLDIHGQRSAEIDGWRLEVNAPTDRQWDLDELRATLAELVAEGTITDAKAKACIRWDPKPVWAELKILLSDPRCKARVAHAMSEVETTRYVRVKRGKGEI
jgi:hypothetical protein